MIRLSSETKLTFKINVNPNDFHFYSLSSAISKVRRIILKYEVHLNYGYWDLGSMLLLEKNRTDIVKTSLANMC